MGISCKQAVDFISKKEKGKLDFKQQIELWSHLAICRFCRAFQKQNRLLISVFRKRLPPEDAKLNAEEKRAIIEVLENAPEI